MTCTRIKDGYLCSSHVYKYKFDGKEYYFEIHPYSGPHPLKKDGELRAKIPGRYSKFWDMFDEFEKLSKEEREKYKV